MQIPEDTKVQGSILPDILLFLKTNYCRGNILSTWNTFIETEKYFVIDFF